MCDGMRFFSVGSAFSGDGRPQGEERRRGTLGPFACRRGHAPTISVSKFCTSLLTRVKEFSSSSSSFSVCVPPFCFPAITQLSCETVNQEVSRGERELSLSDHHLFTLERIVVAKRPSSRFNTLLLLLFFFIVNNNVRASSYIFYFILYPSIIYLFIYFQLLSAAASPPPNQVAKCILFLKTM